MLKRILKTIGRVLLLLLLLCTLVLAAVAFLRWRGYILFAHEADPEQWEVFGVDVSSYQGDIDWPVLVRQGVDFAFIKATEGSGMRDSCFAGNWSEAQAAGVRVGAYHFFSYDSPGLTQAENFIAQVPVTKGALPPVVDIEFYGDKLRHPPSRAAAQAVLDPLLEALEAHYGQKPILYVTYRSYRLYIQGDYQDYTLWFSSPIIAPLGQNWSFWQYSHSAELAGYSGTQPRIDLNVFRGDWERFLQLGS